MVTRLILSEISKFALTIAWLMSKNKGLSVMEKPARSPQDQFAFSPHRPINGD